MRQILILTFALLQFPFGALAYPKSCSPIVIRSTPEIEAIRQQDDGKGHDTSWCFAYSAADLLSYKFGVKISAADAGFQYLAGRRTHESDSPNHVPTPDTLTRLKKVGACLEQNFKSDPSSTGTHPVIFLDRVFLKQDKRFKNLSAEDIRELQTIFPKAQIRSAETQSEGPRLLFELINQSCGTRVRVDNIEVVEKVYDNEMRLARKSDATDVIDQVLKSGQPVETILPFGQIQHSVLVIGRFYDENMGRCMYTLKDSYGPNRSGPIGSTHIFEAEGYIYVPASFLKAQARELTYLN
jgi:hypothetical protein